MWLGRIILVLLVAFSLYSSENTNLGLAEMGDPTETPSPTPDDGRPADAFGGSCGDGMVQPPEQCDLGSLNGTSDCNCDASCNWVVTTSSSTSTTDSTTP